MEGSVQNVFIFVLTPHFIGVILSKNVKCGGVGGKGTKGAWPYRGSMEGWDQTFCTLWMLFLFSKLQKISE